MTDYISKQVGLHEVAWHDEDTVCVYITTQSRFKAFQYRDSDSPDVPEDPDGMWIDLETFDSYEELVEFAEEQFSDEEHPEILFWDEENFPCDEWFNENSLEESLPKIVEYFNLDDNYREAFRDYVELFNCDDFDGFNDHYFGRWDSEEDFAREELSSFLDMDKELGNLSVYFDWERYARDLFCDYEMSEHGHVFSCF